MPVFKGVKYRLVPEIYNSCYGCVFTKVINDNATCPQDKEIINCGVDNTICIEDTPEAAKEYMLLKTKIRLGLEVDYD